jgi:cobalt-zinc-cadmium efflux system protein
MSQQKRLRYLLVLNIAMITGLVAVGLTSHSLGVLAAGGDFIADSLAIVLGLIAVHLRDNKGKQKAPTYVALINGLLLLFITVVVMVQAAHRLATNTPVIHGLPVLIVSVISTFVMILGVFILGRGAGNEDLHMRSVLLDTISDGLAAASVAIVGGIIYFSKGLYWLDSVVALLIGAFIGYSAIKLLYDVSRSLRTGAL